MEPLIIGLFDDPGLGHAVCEGVRLGSVQSAAARAAGGGRRASWSEGDVRQVFGSVF